MYHKSLGPRPFGIEIKSYYNQEIYPVPALFFFVL
ncbi:hypothetical protein EMIT0P100_10387 [Pseudomonas sp. IT-P100]